MANQIVLDAGIPTYVHASYVDPSNPDKGWKGVIHPLGATVVCGHEHIDVTEARLCIIEQFPAYNPLAGLHHPCNPECAFHQTECWNES